MRSIIFGITFSDRSILSRSASGVPLNVQRGILNDRLGGLKGGGKQDRIPEEIGDVQGKSIAAVLVYKAQLRNRAHRGHGNNGRRCHCNRGMVNGLVWYIGREGIAPVVASTVPRNAVPLS